MSEIYDKKHEAHVWFDKLWKNHKERDYYYTRLARDMGLTEELCHFSMMTMEQLDKAITIIKGYWWEKFDR